MSTIAVSGYAAEYVHGEHVEPHIHQEHQIVHAQSGVMRVSSGTATWIIPPDRALWVPARTEHEIVCLTTVATRTVYLSDAGRGLPTSCEVWRVSPLLREVIIRFADEPETPLAAHLVPVLIAELDRLDTVPINFSRARSHKLLKIQEVLLADPADKRTLNQWAAELGALPRTLMRRLKFETGMTYRQWRRQIRILKAIEALATGVSVTGVAYDVGYETTSAFIEAFRQHTGRTPARYFD